ncbi:MAG: PDZ domain-containing protein [Peptococcaceae bacterium]|jgi:serine protease Do|nr:PDZ domain-containing protein [Peptococcaceae bacterium]
MSYFNDEKSIFSGSGKVFFLIFLALSCGIFGGVVSIFGAQQLGLLVLPSQGATSDRLSDVGDDSLGNGIRLDGTLTGNSAVYQEIYKEVGPAVVGVTNYDYYQDFFQGEQQRENGTGSGVIFDAAGYIVTNYHVIEGARKVVVTLSDGSQEEATLIGGDKRSDLAVIKIERENLPTAKLGTSETLQEGETVVAIGNPGGSDFARSITHGIISGLDRLVTTSEGLFFRLIQTDAAINPGNSGGALINMKGEVIGINNIKIAKNGYEGMGFAIPVDTVKEVVAELMDHGEVIRPALGVQMVGEVNEAVATYNNLSIDYGVLVVPQGAGPAAQAGMERYDIITALGDVKVTSAYELQNELFKHKPGDTIKVTVYRNGETLTLDVTLGKLAQ